MTSTAPPGTLTHPRDAAVAAGVATLGMAVAGPFANMTVLGLAGPGPDGAAERIAAGQALLGLAITAFLLVAILDVVLAWAVWRFFGSGHRELPALAAWLRVTYAAVLATAVGHLSTALGIATGPAPDDAAARAALDQFTATWQLGLVVFAAHLAVLGVIVLRDHVTPSLLGVVLLVAGFGYAADGVARLFLPDDAVLLTVLTGLLVASSLLGEVALGIWFLVRGGRSR
ncbi:DUF4386 domain-containing protein [Myceligenerans pegani]|uniref:DUF4386 domain-containing protein n=1 Tax=Myceligenerans pegani TaxID=2776917 RepID=A0ABR9MXB8_9MICO|nr:DUF4386 domain-containing protein [Myceligenerans sp. TRM 65318]MBE1875646.1 DUF4386 domain-containing protein [Myceligenerans sp. TRM 65318]MBE3017917.1 DUF4386 domain-containing protein [Myceligenerans sp. TRM 65318]